MTHFFYKAVFSSKEFALFTPLPPIRITDQLIKRVCGTTANLVPKER